MKDSVKKTASTTNPVKSIKKTTHILKNILLEGHLTNLIGGNPSELRREAKSLEKLKKLADNEKQKVTIENNRLKDKIGVIGRELENLRTKYRIVCNPLL